MATAKPSSTGTTSAPNRRRAAAKPAETAEPARKEAKPARKRRAPAADVQTDVQASVDARSEPAAAAPRPVSDSTTVISSLERRALIARAAYLRAASRGFAPGYETEDWYAAEAEIDAQLGRGS